MRTFISHFLILMILAIGSSSCATVFGRWSNSLVLNSSSGQDAQVYLDDIFIGEAPGRIKLDARRIQHGSVLRLEAEGFEPQEFTILRQASAGYIVANVIATAGVGMAIDFADGYIYRPHPRRIEYRLEKK